MSKMACPCGGVISDVVWPSTTEGWLFKVQDEEKFSEAIFRDITEFFAAIHSGQREKWIRQFFPEPYRRKRRKYGWRHHRLSRQKRQVVGL